MSEPVNGNGRTHEPSLREVTAELDGLKELLLAKLEAYKELLDERDKQYKERYDSGKTAVDAALAAVKEQTKGSFEASEKAIVKAEDAQKAYNTSHNDLARKMDDQNKATMPRAETENRFKSLEEKIALLTGSFSAGSGAAQGAKAVKDESRANIAIIISVIGTLVAVVMVFAKLAP